MGMPWVKLYTEMLDDPKVGFLSEGAQLLFVKLILLAGECDAEGYVANGDDPLSPEQIAWRLRIPLDQIEQRLSELTGARLIEDCDGILLVANFQERQGRSQSEKRKQWRDRKQKQRGNERDSENVTRDTDENPAGVTPLEGEGEGEREREGEERKTPAAPPPAPAVAVWEEVMEERAPPEYWPDEMAHVVGDVQDDLDLWRRTLHQWRIDDHRADNIDGQLDRFRKNKLNRDDGVHSTGPPGGSRSTVDEMAALLEEEDS